MSIAKISYRSKVMQRDMEMTVLIPAYEHSDAANPAERYKTVYFLPGFRGSAEGLIRKVLISEAASENNLAVVLVNGENMFYTDSEGTGKMFSTWLGTELPEVMESIFPFSDKPEETYIGGISMGGYGALINGLRFSERFSKIAILSPAMVVYQNVLDGKTEYDDLISSRFAEKLFGTAEELEKSYKNPEYVFAAGSKKKMPDIYMTCGTEDFVYSSNVRLVRAANRNNVNLKFVEGSGGHTAEFWNRAIPEAFQFLAG